MEMATMKAKTPAGAIKALSLQQKNFFKKSVVRDNDGELLPVYHGTGTNIVAFDPSFTGHGNDQYGSGFYFTDNWNTAQSYVTAHLIADDGSPLPKLGGEDNPHVVAAYLNLCNPIFVDGIRYSNLRHIEVSGSDAYRILQRMPALYYPISSGDMPNPLGDFFPEVWDKEPSTAREFTQYIKKLAMHYFSPTNLLLLDVFFKDFPTQLRQALRDVLGYDGVIVRFGEDNHYIAWFPEQIKSIDNTHPTDSVNLNA